MAVSLSQDSRSQKAPSWELGVHRLFVSIQSKSTKKAISILNQRGAGASALCTIININTLHSARPSDS